MAESERRSNFIISGAVSAPLCATISVAYFNSKVRDCQTNKQIRFVHSEKFINFVTVVIITTVIKYEVL